jgi:serine/threonine protein kinase
MLHQIAIEHGLDHYILFPYAEHGDLEHFLHCGALPKVNASKDQWRSEFAVFSRKDRRAKMVDLLKQCAGLAHGIEWLHGGITVQKTANQVFCAHMDLKPSNILIKKSNVSDVGQWMISDFGISAFTESSGGPRKKYGTIRDYYQDVTLNTHHRRSEGTYQAPEVCYPRDFPHSEKVGRRAGGRKSDIWSFGCILSEVLAFALGERELVTNFQTHRFERSGAAINFLFHSRKSSMQLHPTNAQSYEIRPAVTQWLSGLSDYYSDHKLWIEHCVNTITKILIVNPSARPEARQLRSYVVDTKTFAESSHRSDSLLPSHSPELRAQPSQNSLYAPPSEAQEVETASTITTETDAQDFALVSGESNTRSTNSSNQQLPALRQELPLSPTHSAHHIRSGSSSIQSTASRRLSLDNFTAKIGTHNPPRLSIVPWVLKYSVKDFALSTSGDKVAYWVNSNIRFCEIDVLKQTSNFMEKKDITIDVQLRKITLAGEWFLAWTKQSGVSNHALLSSISNKNRFIYTNGSARVPHAS